MFARVPTVEDVACYCYEEAGRCQIAGCQTSCEEGDDPKADCFKADSREPISVQAPGTSCC